MRKPPTVTEVAHSLYGIATSWRMGGWDDFAISPYIPSYDEEGREDPFQFFTVRMGGQVFDIRVREEVQSPQDARRLTSIEKAAYNLLLSVRSPIKGQPRSLVDRVLLQELDRALLNKGYRS